MKNPLSLLAGVLSVFALVATQNTNAGIVKKSVTYEDNGKKLIGFLAYDDAKTAAGKQPGVLVIPEWWGLNDYAKTRAEQLAELGYVAFAADMYGRGENTEDAKKAGELSSPFYGKSLMPERAKAGLDALIKTGLADESKLAAIGFCFGGSAVETLAYSGAPLRGIVAFHGGPVDAPAEVKGKVKAKFLLLNGGSDPMVPAEAKQALEKSLDAAEIQYQSIDYPGALHAYSNPDADRMAAKNGLTGKIGYNEAAATKSWAEMKAFLSGIFARN